MKQWREIKNLGDVYFETELVYGNELILFTAFIHNQRYLIETIDSNSGVYLIAEISNDDLLKMLTNKVPMDETFRTSKNTYITVQDKMYNLIAKRISPSELPTEYLPDSGEYFELESDEITLLIKGIRM